MYNVYIVQLSEGITTMIGERMRESVKAVTNSTGMFFVIFMVTMIGVPVAVGLATEYFYDNRVGSIIGLAAVVIFWGSLGSGDGPD